MSSTLLILSGAALLIGVAYMIFQRLSSQKDQLQQEALTSSIKSTNAEDTIKDVIDTKKMDERLTLDPDLAERVRLRRKTKKLPAPE